MGKTDVIVSSIAFHRVEDFEIWQTFNKKNHQYYKVIRVLSLCMYVCVYLHNSGMAGPIWLNLFLLAPSWSRGGLCFLFVKIFTNVDFEKLFQICIGLKNEDIVMKNLKMSL